MAMPVKTVGILAAKPGKATELKALLLDLADACRAEPGNLHWDVWQDRAEQSRFVLDELYKDNQAMLQHRETPHYKAYAARVNDLAERTVLMLDPTDVA